MKLPEHIDSVAGLEVVDAERERLRLASQWWWAGAALGLILTVVTGSVATTRWGSGLGGVAVLLAFATAGLVVRGTVMVARYNAAKGRLVAAMEAVQPESLRIDPLAAGELIGSYQVLQADDQKLHITRRGDRKGTQLAQAGWIATGLVFVGAFIMYACIVGAWPHVLSVKNVRSALGAWLSLGGGLGLILRGLWPCPTEWYASRDLGEIVIERVKWIFGRDVVAVALTDMRFFALHNRELRVLARRRSSTLLVFPPDVPVEKFKRADAKDACRKVASLRGKRVQDAVRRALGDQAPERLLVGLQEMFKEVVERKAA